MKVILAALVNIASHQRLRDLILILIDIEP